MKLLISFSNYVSGRSSKINDYQTQNFDFYLTNILITKFDAYITDVRKYINTYFLSADLALLPHQSGAFCAQQRSLIFRSLMNVQYTRDTSSKYPIFLD